MAQVTMMGNPIEVSGNFPQKGKKVTALTLTNKELADITLDAYAGVNITTGPIAGLTARSVIVLDENNNVLHSELVSEIKNEPNYEAALAAL